MSFPYVSQTKFALLSLKTPSALRIELKATCVVGGKGCNHSELQEAHLLSGQCIACLPPPLLISIIIAILRMIIILWVCFNQPVQATATPLQQHTHFLNPKWGKVKMSKSRFALVASEYISLLSYTNTQPGGIPYPAGILRNSLKAAANHPLGETTRNKGLPHMR